jgi:hypothetical protein
MDYLFKVAYPGQRKDIQCGIDKATVQISIRKKFASSEVIIAASNAIDLECDLKERVQLIYRDLTREVM